MKRRGLVLLARAPMASLHAFVPSDHDDLRLDLCDDHDAALREALRTGTVDSDIEYYEAHEDEIAACPDCLLDRFPHRHSSYVIRVEAGGERFVLFLPAAEGERFLPPIEHLPREGARVEHSWNGLAYTKRPEAEVVYFSQKRVGHELDVAIVRFRSECGIWARF